MFKILTAGLLAFLYVGCSQVPKPVASLNQADTVEQHILTGMSLLASQKRQEAVTQCKRAVSLAPQNASAFICLALATQDTSVLEKSFDFIDNAVDSYRYHVAKVRMSEVDEAYEHYKMAKNIEVKYLPYYNDKESADYFLALKYFEYLEYEKTREFSAHVFKNAQAKFAPQSRVLWERVDRVIRALALSEFTVTAKKLVLNEQIKRVDIAVVLEDELALAKIMKGAFQADRKAFAKKVSKDVQSHPNLPQIEVFYKYGLRGLEPKVSQGNEMFLPNSFITRADFSLLLEDIIAKVLHDTKLKTTFFGNKSLFVDVTNDSYYFNAVNTAVARGFLKANINSAFRPHEYLTGIELIEAIARVKEEMR
ncbi:S-layer homology domain-containing protein [Sulfurimonas sp. SAG-AH-194-I05]|nr:S-layer homology domain-containing protein [Sulfurimonas sp. SAG-AH-194-I05]MDF1875238.1 S-layer homology domain-containing protein [Sulfurimonas sp. SAG-AH-194-I05]